MSLRIAVLGMGAHGRTVALELATDPRVSNIVLVDKHGERARVLLKSPLMVSASARVLDVRDGPTLRKLLSEVDVAVNMTPEEHNLAIMRECLEARCGYVDTASFYPPTDRGPGDIYDQLDQDRGWQERGLTAIVGLGSDPGLPNILARMASDQLQAIHEIRIRRAATATKALDGYPLYSGESFLRYALFPPEVWEEGHLVHKEPGSGEEDFEFPPPIGRRRVTLFRSESVVTVPLRLGKPVGRVDYKHDIRSELVLAIHALNRLGFFEPNRLVRILGAQTTFKEAFLQTFPDPIATMSLRVGAWAMVVEALGTTSEGMETTIRGSVLMENLEATARRETTPEQLLSSRAAAAGALLIGAKKTPRPGVLVPEEFPPAVIIPELERRGVKLHMTRTAG
jgi:saccharopine dehydrogenase (NAD+, L-lysine-forming)